MRGRYYNNWSIDGITTGLYIQDLYSCYACTGNKTPVLIALNDHATPKIYEPYGL